ncbi:MAG TPA: hypothetical protein VES68_04055 [Candidatus Sulfotelmatobacter sp.]|nr:hypothetical protein [Candidatus Sulfotelmatobacter sp.]
MVKRQLAVVYFDVNKILFYGKDTKKNLELDLPTDVVSDLEVVAKDKFDQLIDTFFQTDTLKNVAFDVILVFSQGVSFEKDFTDDTTKVKYEETQKFLDMVPFEDILSNSFKINKKTKVVAVNKGLFDMLHLALERNRAYVVLVLSASVLLETNPELANNLDLGIIATKFEALKQYGLVEINQGGLALEKKNSIGIKKKDVRLYALLGVFVLLLVVLLFLIYTTFLSPQKIKKTQTVIPNTSVVPTNTSQITPLSSESGKIISPNSQQESTPSSNSL